MTIWAAAIVGAGCGGKAGQSPDGGRGDGVQAGGSDGHGPTDAAMDMLSPLDAADVPPGSDAADAPPGGDAADAPPGSDAASDAVGTGPDGGKLPGVWYELGGSGTGEGLDPGTSGSDPVIAIDVAGHPLVAWRSQNVNPGLSLKHWNGSAWGGLGLSDRDAGVASQTGSSGAPGFALTGGGVPILAWAAGPAMARRWQARAWEPIGTSTTTAGLSNGVTADFVSMAVDGAGRPVVAWRVVPPSSQAASKIMLRAWDGASWVERGGSATGNGVSGQVIVRGLQLAVDAQGRMVLAWEEWQTTSASSAFVRVRRWNGTAWDVIDAPLATSMAMSPRVAIDSAGRPILAWQYRAGNAIYLQRWNGTTWDELGGSASGGGVSGTGRAQAPAIAIDEQDRIAVAWEDGGQSDVYLRMWDGQAWNELGGSASGAGISGTPGVTSQQIAVAARGNRVCASWNENLGAIQMRCFDEAPRFCSCDTSSACETGCACDVNCVVPAWDDFACPAGAYRCHDGRCVAGAVACNGVSECADGSDESALCPNGALFDSPRGTGGCNGWVCGDGSCVGATRCDRVVQCADGSDEDAVCDLPSSFAREATVTGLDVFGVWAGPSGAWAAGSSGTVVHRDAGVWTRQPLSFGSYDLRSIWGSGSSSLFATINGSLLYWNGSTWSLLNLPTSASQRLWALWGTGPSDIWAVGSSTTGSNPAVAWHATSPTTWTAIDPQLAGRLWGVGGTATDDVWAVGDAGAILHWNGSAFSATTSGTSSLMYGVWGDARASAWAVGDQGTIVRWTGGPGWAPITPITRSVLYGIWGASAGDVWAVGGGGVILHWNGAKWTNVWSGTSDTLTSVAGSGSDVWIGGPRGYILHLAR